MSNNADTPKPMITDAVLEAFFFVDPTAPLPEPEPWDDRDHDTRDEIGHDYYYD